MDHDHETSYYLQYRLCEAIEPSTTGITTWTAPGWRILSRIDWLIRHYSTLLLEHSFVWCRNVPERMEHDVSICNGMLANATQTLVESKANFLLAYIIYR
jgi:hypothetical protein